MPRRSLETDCSHNSSPASVDFLTNMISDCNLWLQQIITRLGCRCFSQTDYPRSIAFHTTSSLGKKTRNRDTSCKHQQKPFLFHQTTLLSFELFCQPAYRIQTRTGQDPAIHKCLLSRTETYTFPTNKARGKGQQLKSARKRPSAGKLENLPRHCITLAVSEGPPRCAGGISPKTLGSSQPTVAVDTGNT